MSGSPEELLRSALEKIVFFECRLASLESELDAARSNVARVREEAGAARRREVEVETALAQVRGERAVATAHNAELRERVRLLEAERERFLSGLVERARVAGAPAGEGDAAGSEDDLAGFISELRAEIEVLRAWKCAAEAAGVKLEGAAPRPAPVAAPTSEFARVAAVPAEEPARVTAAAPAAAEAARVTASAEEPARVTPAAVSALATRFEAAGRIGVSHAAACALPTFATRSERALFQASLDDLGAADPAARRRAADGLRALGSRDAAPLVAASLGREEDAEVKAALLAALGALAEPGAADLALRELADPRPAVRAAALEAASALTKERATPHLAAALGDRSPLVRRRAAVLLGFTAGEAAVDALAAALGDGDPGVARAAAVALSGRPSARAQGALAKALSHAQPEVRRAAARAVGRWSGEAVDTSAPEAERRRAARRITEKLLAVDAAELRNAVTRVPTSPRARPPIPAPGLGPGLARGAGDYVAVPAHAPVRASEGAIHSQSTATSAPPPWKGAGRGEGRPAGAGALLHSAVAVAMPEADPGLAFAALAEVRTALRGRTTDELAATLSCDRAAVEASLRALVAQGQLVARGPRFFMS